MARNVEVKMTIRLTLVDNDHDQATHEDVAEALREEIDGLGEVWCGEEGESSYSIEATIIESSKRKANSWVSEQKP